MFWNPHQVADQSHLSYDGQSLDGRRKLYLLILEALYLQQKMSHRSCSALHGIARSHRDFAMGDKLDACSFRKARSVAARTARIATSPSTAARYIMRQCSPTFTGLCY